jgi:hypothetical protein
VLVPTRTARKKSCAAARVIYAGCLGGLVAQSVEQCPFNSKRPVLAIFSRFLFPFATIAEPLIPLVNFNVYVLSHVISQNPKKIIWVTSRVQVLTVDEVDVTRIRTQILTPRLWL